MHLFEPGDIGVHLAFGQAVELLFLRQRLFLIQTVGIPVGEQVNEKQKAYRQETKSSSRQYVLRNLLTDCLDR